MKNAQNEFDELNKNRKIELLKKQSSHLMPFLTKTPEELNDKELSDLNALGEVEESAKGASKELSSKLSSMIKPFIKNFDQNIEALKLNKTELLLVNSVFKKTILAGVSKASDDLFSKLQKNTGFLYNQMLSEKVLDVLNSIMDFKTEIDKKFPGLSDKILSAAAPIIVSAVSYCMPPVGIALKATGILDKTANFLKTENLKKTIDKISSDLKDIKQDNQLKDLEQKTEAIIVITKKTDVSSSVLSKLGLSKEALQETLKEVSHNPESKALLQDLCEYAKHHIPNNKMEVNQMLETLQEAALKELETKAVSKEMVADIKQSLEKSFAEAAAEMYSTLDQDAKPLDKISSNQKSSDILIKAAAHLSKTMAEKYPENSKAIKAAANSLENNAKEKIAGDIKKIATKLINNSKGKGFAKKTLGAGLANEIMMKRSIESKAVSRGR